nr:transposase [Spirabiliibacterium mucosae]
MLKDRNGITRGQKLQALERAKEVGVVQAAKELGVSKTALYNWRAAYEMHGDTPPETPTVHTQRTVLKQINQRLENIEAMIQQLMEKKL